MGDAIRFENTGYIMNYNTLMNSDQNDIYSKTNTEISEYQAQQVPQMIINGLGIWDEYCSRLESMNPEEVTEMYKEIVE